MSAAIMKRGNEIRIANRQRARELNAQGWYIVAWIRERQIIRMDDLAVAA